MSEEIKEIINDIRKTADNSIFVVCSSREELDKIPKYTANFLSVNDRQAKILLDYITNLQEENNRLNNIIKELTQENLKRSDKIDELLEIKNKAIDYIEEKGRLKYKPDELINILQGSDKE